MLARDEHGRIMPENMRLNYRHSIYSADQDRHVFNMWAKGEITPDHAAMLISVNNTCPCTKEQFIANAEWLGYTPMGSWELWEQ